MDQTQADEVLSFIVHNYTNASCLLSAPQTIIEAGRNDIDSACLSDGWCSVNWDFDASIYNGRGKAFRLAQAPPIAYSCDQQAEIIPVHALKEWGTPADDTDDSIDLLENLPEFESTDLEWLSSFVGRYAGVSSIQAGHDISGNDRNIGSWTTSAAVDHKVLPPNDPGPRPTKRCRLDNNLSHDMIPYPHYHPSPFADYPSLDTHLLTAYAKSQPIPIPPYDLSKIKDYLATSYARSAWIIPIRGILPWEGCTSAIVLDGALPSGPGHVALSAHHDRHIEWTRRSVVSLWNFLLAIQQAKMLGPISISFHATPPHTLPFTSHTNSFDPPVANSNYNAPSEGVASQSFASHPVRMSLPAVDHIKVFHDVTCAMYLRNVLDAWSYHFQSTDDGSSQGIDDKDSASKAEGKNNKGSKERQIAIPRAGVTSKKIRMLKGAILTLVDETSNGVLLS